AHRQLAGARAAHRQLARRPRRGALYLVGGHHLENRRLRHGAVFGGPSRRAARAARGRVARRRLGAAPVLSFHLAAAPANHGVRRHHQPDPELSGVRRGAGDDAGRPRSGHDGVRVRDLRAGLFEPARRPSQCAVRDLFLRAARPHAGSAVAVAAQGGGVSPAAHPCLLGPGQRRAVGSRAFVTLTLAVVSLLWLLPYAWMVLTSFKTLPEIVTAPAAPLPAGLEWGAYAAVFDAMPVGRYFWNTTVMALGIAAIQIAVALPAAYALAKLDFKGRTLAFGLVVATLLIPAQARFVHEFSWPHAARLPTMSAA